MGGDGWGWASEGVRRARACDDRGCATTGGATAPLSPMRESGLARFFILLGAAVDLDVVALA